MECDGARAEGAGPSALVYIHAAHLPCRHMYDHLSVLETQCVCVLVALVVGGRGHSLAYSRQSKEHLDPVLDC